MDLVGTTNRVPSIFPADYLRSADFHCVALHRIMRGDASTGRFSDVPAYGQILLRRLNSP
jgi:hypothetical protein